MTAWSLDNSANSKQMLNGEVEQDKVHRDLSLGIIVLQLLFGLLLQLYLVLNLFIRSGWITEGRKDISEDKASVLVEGVNLPVFVRIEVLAKHIKAHTQVTLAAFFNVFDEPHHVFVVDQTVTEYACDFVTPQTHDDILRRHFLRCAQTDAADDLAEVTQVERVVRLGGSWL